MAAADQPAGQLVAICAALRLLADDEGAPRAPADGERGSGHRRLDARSRALVELGALLATGGGPGSYERCVAEARTAGVTAEEVVDLLVAVAPTVGLARLVPVAIDVALALGYDVDHALEVVDEPRVVQPVVS